ncbi:HupE/UreJ family protein [Microvirga arsenatis]|uniref:Urease accessory protein n=1 Tax=Microvirga arsenatis TaxID=2692265 RepID=A0ABW9YX47_9HYPH|nr:HupE/UreJ family protein [Microvirga arsenatis]NBJ11650.1 urease accessory protein [Microvirga arsenatis]NBJ24931.1 urease accessory protein [Microvirga arsenatis]
MRLKHSFLVASMIVTAMPALAHTGIHPASGLGDGFAHPFGGLDHTLAMVAVGLFAAVLGGQALWAVPTTFASVMLVGGIMGFMGIHIPAVEAGIALSVVIFGAVLAAKIRCRISVAMMLTGMFAVFHGYAHGAEMPMEAAAAPYCLGFFSATILLHGAGLAIGIALSHRQTIYRWAGAGISIAGVVLSLS